MYKVVSLSYTSCSYNFNSSSQSYRHACGKRVCSGSVFVNILVLIIIIGFLTELEVG